MALSGSESSRTTTMTEVFVCGMFFNKCSHHGCNKLFEKRQGIHWCTEHIPVCSTCLDDVDGTSIDVCGFGHYFHIKCASEAVRHGIIRCPNCRRFITQDAMDKVIEYQIERLLNKMRKLPSDVRQPFVAHCNDLANVLILNSV